MPMFISQSCGELQRVAACEGKMEDHESFKLKATRALAGLVVGVREARGKGLNNEGDCFKFLLYYTHGQSLIGSAIRKIDL